MQAFQLQRLPKQRYRPGTGQGTGSNPVLGKHGEDKEGGMRRNVVKDKKET